MENWGDILENWGDILENWGDSLENWGVASENWGVASENWGDILEFEKYHPIFIKTLPSSYGTLEIPVAVKPCSYQARSYQAPAWLYIYIAKPVITKLELGSYRNPAL